MIYEKLGENFVAKTFSFKLSKNLIKSGCSRVFILFSPLIRLTSPHHSNLSYISQFSILEYRVTSEKFKILGMRIFFRVLFEMHNKHFQIALSLCIYFIIFLNLFHKLNLSQSLSYILELRLEYLHSFYAHLLVIFRISLSNCSIFQFINSDYQ